MTHQTNAQRRVSEFMNRCFRHLAEGKKEYTEAEVRLVIAGMQSEISTIEQARDVAVEMAAQYAAERDQLRAQLAALKDGQAGVEVVTVTGKLGDLCSFHSLSVRKGDKLYTSYVATTKPVPMTDERLAEVLTTAYGSPEWTMDDVRAARAIEAHHGISEVQG